ncbi:hypothetical protein HZF08_03815 [Paenibacillus sp. CGMCC 1.16610]|uniref:Uncharacterized protein n=1 Tax=Paenibacillus anseongense TaxID=2682845 RepID=A0ABW9U8M3_9BACL|nr:MULTISPECIES: hypothetical protein [Paenibacillus]MBA2937419.1 hypothetical protein [Paenibacillus sp. CGMCC 1.16610]MVQ36477.1 hypothetical protein [Paenibacillus anseongense]
MFEDLNKAICNFYLSIKEEAEVLWCFTDADHKLVFSSLKHNFIRHEDLKEFIESRTIFIENNYTYWYSPRSIQELFRIIEDNPITYRCRVLFSDDDINNPRFRIHVYEHYNYKSSETRALLINEEKIENDYVSNILPRIKNIQK